MNLAKAITKEERYTYADYLTWDDDVRYELIDGVAYALAAPSTTHQRVLGRLANTILNFLKGKKCELFIAPYDVRLNFDTLDDTVVQPDLLVICDKSKIVEKGCNGVPELVIEILSPSTARKDILKKYQIYLKAGVLEYWIVDPETNEIDIFSLSENKYNRREYNVNDVIASTILKGFELKLSEIFDFDIIT
jgi:Uma2 family endonuclease